MIRCCIHRDGAITCHVHRNWLMRLLGFDDVDMEVEWTGALWCNADNGAYVGHRIAGAIEREMTKLSAGRRLDLRFRQ